MLGDNGNRTGTYEGYMLAMKYLLLIAIMTQLPKVPLFDNADHDEHDLKLPPFCMPPDNPFQSSVGR